MRIFDLLRAARGVSAGIWMVTLGLLAAGVLLDGIWFLGLIVFGPLFLGPKLQGGLDIEEKASRVANYARNLEHTLRELLAATGCRSLRELTLERLFIPWDTPEAQSRAVALPPESAPAVRG